MQSGAVQNMKKRALKSTLAVAAKRLQPLKVHLGQLGQLEGVWHCLNIGGGLWD